MKLIENVTIQKFKYINNFLVNGQWSMAQQKPVQKSSTMTLTYIRIDRSQSNKMPLDNNGGAKCRGSQNLNKYSKDSLL